MPVAQALRRHGTAGVRRVSAAEPILPFLYNTQTIRTRYTDALSDFEDLQERGFRRSKRTNKDRKLFVSGARNRAPDSKNFRKTLGPYENRDGGESEMERPRRPEYERQEHIPFEDARNEKRSVRDTLSNSTMTPSEKKAFEKLLNMKQKKEGKEGKEGGEALQQLDGILQEAFEQTAGQPDDLEGTPAESVTREQKTNESRRDSRSAMEQEAIEADRENVKEAFSKAQTDVELWKLLHDKVLSRVLALKLDEPLARSAQRATKAKSDKNDEKNADADPTIPQWPGNVRESTVIRKNAPWHLIAFQQECISSFPSSQLGLSLMPYLKSLGPATFALIAGSTFYNNHMRILYRRYLDVPSIIDTLEDMDKEVFDFSEKTHMLLSVICSRDRSVRRGMYGPGCSALWSGERFRNATGRAFVWKRRVDNRLQEQALKSAREQEEEESRQTVQE